MMLQIKRSCENPQKAIASHEPKEFAEFYAQYLGPQLPPRVRRGASTDDIKQDSTNQAIYSSKQLRSSSISAPTKPNTRQQVLQLNSNQPPHKPKCIIRRNDGVLVKLQCPKCQRENFGSAQGFINHCRISHSLEFTTHDAAAVECGKVVEEQDEVGLEAQQRNGGEAAATTIENPAPAAVMRVEPTAPTKQPISYIPCGPEISTKNLNLLIKKRRLTHLDVDSLAQSSLTKFAKGHLLDSEEEDSDDPIKELGDEATPFERALAEAKKLKLDVDEIRRNAPAPPSASGGSSKPNKKKRGGSSRNRRGSSRVSSASGATTQRAAVAYDGPPITRSASAESKPPSALSASTASAGKSRPGFAPSHWSSQKEGIFGKMVPGKAVPGKSIPGKSIPGKPNLGAPIPGKSVPGKSVPGKSVPGKTIPGKTLPGTITKSGTLNSNSPWIKHRTESRSTVRTTTGMGRIDSDDADSDNLLDDEDGMSDDDQEADGDDRLMKDSTPSKGGYHAKPVAAAGKTLPGNRSNSTSASGRPSDNLQKFISLSRFF